jgi:uncharacterized membrane protein YkgB
MIEWLKGKKTYIIAVIIGVVATLNYLGVVIPEYVWGILAAFGLGFLRAGIKK